MQTLLLGHLYAQSLTKTKDLSSIKEHRSAIDIILLFAVIFFFMCKEGFPLCKLLPSLQTIFGDHLLLSGTGFVLTRCSHFPVLYCRIWPRLYCNIFEHMLLCENNHLITLHNWVTLVAQDQMSRFDDCVTQLAQLSLIFCVVLILAVAEASYYEL